ncbi:hypothetical protein TeGR_g13276, partial [Tetraparma gracilis]
LLLKSPTPGANGGSVSPLPLNEANLVQHTQAADNHWVCMKCIISVQGNFCSNCGSGQVDLDGLVNDILDDS